MEIFLVSPEIMLLETYKIFFKELTFMHLVTANNKNLKIMGTILSAVIKLSSSYTDPFLQAEFIQFV